MKPGQAQRDYEKAKERRRWALTVAIEEGVTFRQIAIETGLHVSQIYRMTVSLRHIHSPERLRELAR